MKATRNARVLPNGKSIPSHVIPLYLVKMTRLLDVSVHEHRPSFTYLLLQQASHDTFPVMAYLQHLDRAV